MNNTLLLISAYSPNIGPNKLLTASISADTYAFFYFNAALYADQSRTHVDVDWQRWGKDRKLVLSCCRTALLRRKLLQEDEMLSHPWQLASLTEFYDTWKNSAQLMHISATNTVKIPVNPNAPLVFQLDQLAKFTYPEELIELIIAATLFFDTHVHCRENITGTPWQKYLSALTHYDVPVHASMPAHLTKEAMILQI